MNQVILMGRLTRDPDVRYTRSDHPMAIARYTLAVDRHGAKDKGNNEPNADFINCVAFDRAGEFAERYFKKGMRVLISGRIQTGSYVNRRGDKTYTTDVIIQTQEFAESRNEDSGAGRAGAMDVPPPMTDAEANGFMNIPDGIEDGLPFD